ncbi:patatin-like phospholipase family protein [Variovorax sp. PCZ-1]|uniref:patatin-like phospholipase family protein n=1 Tax=Variovorax sp. PCZ-1 TaxID=2835533 RepID=UPI001BD0A069|nr:patatin-like phospholipase family protein [Variovorax sp. PCZ-1]MBS7807606.1 patatin-like phospholipase family protein [Variovorax sp. PCZ-1]
MLFSKLKIYLLAATLLVLSACTTAPTQPPAPSAHTTTPDPVVAKRPPKIGLALGGGAARGFAHVGVIAALEEAGIKVDYVVGTSAGSLVGAIYASGKNAAQLQEIALKMEEAEITDWTLPFFSRGILRGEALSNYINRQVNNKLIESLPIPLGIVATDLKSGQGTLFQSGDTGRAVRASSSVPSVFNPVKIGDREYVDGGLVAPVPVRYAKQMGAELIIAVDISAAPEGNAADGTVAVLLQTFAIMGKSINEYALQGADVVVRPELVGVKSGDFTAKRRSIEAGKLAMQRLMPQLKAAIEAKSK